MRVLELFAGIGACSTALTRLGIEHEIVDAVEIDKYAMASFNAIHGTNFEPQDITTWDKDLTDIDLIMHGSPCQDFSLAGKQAGGDENSGTRSSLMYETVRIVGKIKPKYVVWENVKNILSQKHRHNFEKYLVQMQELGYNNYYQVLNAKDYGIPQNRERVFTVSIRQDIDTNTFKFPEKQVLKLRLKDMLEEEVDEKYYLSDKQIASIKATSFTQAKNRIQENEYADCLLGRDWKDPKCIEVERIGGMFDTDDKTKQAGAIFDKNGLSPTLTDMQGGYRQPMIVASYQEHATVREDQESFVENKYKSFIEKNGYIPEMFNPYNETEIRDVAPTQSTCCGSNISSAAVLIKNATKQGYLEAHEGDGIDISSRMQYHRGNVQNQMVQTLVTNGNERGVVVSDKKMTYNNKGKVQDTEKECCVLQAAMGEGGGNIPLVTAEVINPLKGVSGNSWQFEQQVYDENGITRAVKAGGGSGNIPKVIIDSNQKEANDTYEEIEHQELIEDEIKDNINDMLWRRGLQKEEKGQLRIRKLTPKECFRLMRFPR